MHCNKFIVETLVHKEWLLDKSIVPAQVLSYKHLDEPLDKGRLIFECILAGNLQAFTKCS